MDWRWFGVATFSACRDQKQENRANWDDRTWPDDTTNQPEHKKQAMAQTAYILNHYVQHNIHFRLGCYKPDVDFCEAHWVEGPIVSPWPEEDAELPELPPVEPWPPPEFLPIVIYYPLLDDVL